MKIYEYKDEFYKLYQALIAEHGPIKGIVIVPTKRVVAENGELYSEKVEINICFE